jgi:hypothetical protein
VSNRAFTQHIAHPRYNVVRSPPSRFVDDDHTVQCHASGIVYVEALAGQILAQTLKFDREIASLPHPPQ